MPTNQINKWKQIREAVFPGQLLCQVKFSDGASTNDFLPKEVFERPDINPVDWFNENKKEEYLSLKNNTRKVVKISQIQDAD